MSNNFLMKNWFLTLIVLVNGFSSNELQLTITHFKYLDIWTDHIKALSVGDNYKNTYSNNIKCQSCSLIIYCATNLHNPCSPENILFEKFSPPKWSLRRRSFLITQL